MVFMGNMTHMQRPTNVNVIRLITRLFNIISNTSITSKICSQKLPFDFIPCCAYLNPPI
jgi:hypothetical protein